MRELNAILAIAYRDLMKFLRDRPRLVATLIFPFVIIGALGGSLEASLGGEVGFNFLAFVFTGVYAQTLFQSSAMGIVSLIADRETDFSQEMFVSPISRYSIVFGKIVGESLVALPQGLAIVAFALIIGIPFSIVQLLALAIVAVPICLFGGAFGLLVLGNIGTQRAATNVFPFIMLPQFFLAGVFNPLHGLPWYLDVLSRISPMRYAVDLGRNAFYTGHPDAPRVVLADPLFNLLLIGALFGAFLAGGTLLFVRAERNR